MRLAMIGVEHDSRPPVTSNGSAGTSPNAAAASRSLPTTPDPSLSLHCLLAIMVMATQSGIVRGQRDLAAFAAKLTQFQLRALGSYRKRCGGRDYPKETTFQRIFAMLDAEVFERILIDWEIQRAGQVTDDDQIAIDGKAQRSSTPHVEHEQKAQLVSVQSQPSGRVLGTVAVERRRNEIPAARKLLEKLDPLDAKLLMLDALHPCPQTLRQAHQDNGADFLIPDKGNHPELQARAAACLPDRSPAVISPLGPAPGHQPAAGAVRYLQAKIKTTVPVAAQGGDGMKKHRHHSNLDLRMFLAYTTT